MLSLSNILKAGVIGGLGTLSLGCIIESEMKRYNTETLKPIDTVSIIMPSFNEENFIGTAVSSIKNQSTADYKQGHPRRPLRPHRA